MKPGLPIILSCLILFVSGGGITCAQTLGGNSVFNFLELANTPQLTALGGQNITNQSNDVGMVFHNPSLLRESMHTQANFVFNAMYGDVKNYHLQIAYRHERLATNFAFGVQYFNYGSIDQTDPSGNIMGALRPTDYVLQLSMSRKYGERWFYGASLKFINSNYGLYRSSGIGADLGVSYLDSMSGLQASLVIKNMGTQLRAYNHSGKEELPFDLQVGVSKKLANAPLQFSLTANRLHRFDVTYNDTAYNTENGLSEPGGKFSFDNIFRHIVIATQVYITDKVEVSLGYNYLRRRELNAGGTGNGINGFSAGVGLLFKKIQLRYARSYYQASRSYHQVGVNLPLNEYMSLGRLGKRIGW